MKKLPVMLCLAPLVLYAQTSVVVERFDKLYGEARIAGALDSSVVAEFDVALDSLRTADGIVLDLRELKAPTDSDAAQHEYLNMILGRLISRGMELQPSGIAARGEWQYSDPVVILCDSIWANEPLTTAFAKSRDYGERILSGSEDKARERVKLLVRRKELMDQDRMQRMYEPISPQPTQR